jgi:hypothetical protein
LSTAPIYFYLVTVREKGGREIWFTRYREIREAKVFVKKFLSKRKINYTGGKYRYAFYAYYLMVPMLFKDFCLDPDPNLNNFSCKIFLRTGIPVYHVLDIYWGYW